MQESKHQPITRKNTRTTCLLLSSLIVCVWLVCVVVLLYVVGAVRLSQNLTKGFDSPKSNTQQVALSLGPANQSASWAPDGSALHIGRLAATASGWPDRIYRITMDHQLQRSHLKGSGSDSQHQGNHRCTGTRT